MDARIFLGREEVKLSELKVKMRISLRLATPTKTRFRLFAQKMLRLARERIRKSSLSPSFRIAMISR
jgi:hypothetical protein